MCRKSKKIYDDDDGRTIANMNVEGASWYTGDDDKTRHDRELKQTNLTARETWAMILAAYRAYLPALLSIILGFGIAMLIIWLWLK